MEARIRFSFFRMIQSEVPEFEISDIDSIVTSYILSILEDLLDSQDASDEFDVEGFKEMLQAYLPQSTLIKDDDLTGCMLQLVDEMKGERDAKEQPGLDIKSLIADTTRVNAPTRKGRSISETSGEEGGKKKGGRISETSETDVDEAALSTLLDMFPSSCQVEAVHCLTVTGGDLERAVQLLLTRAEMGEDIKPNQTMLLAKLSRPVEMDDKSVKKKIMDKYGFVDKEEDRRYHRPNVSKKTEDKKLIRYREGKIVSTKGERFTRVSKEESLEMKRSIKI